MDVHTILYVLQFVVYTLMLIHYWPKLRIHVTNLKKKAGNEVNDAEAAVQQPRYAWLNLAWDIVQIGLLVVIIQYVLFHFIPRNVFTLISNHWKDLLNGLYVTIGVSLLAICFGTMAGLLIGFFITRKTRLYIIKGSLVTMIYILLSIPALVLILFLWYSNLVNSTFAASVIALSINLSPFVAKIIASSINNISADQINAAIALGYSPWQIIWDFKIGYVTRTSLQPLLVEYYTTIKLSSFAGLIGLYEIYHNTQDIIRDSQDPASAYMILTMCYIILVAPLALLADVFENNWRKRSLNKK